MPRPDGVGPWTGDRIAIADDGTLYTRPRSGDDYQPVSSGGSAHLYEVFLTLGFNFDVTTGTAGLHFYDEFGLNPGNHILVPYEQSDNNGIYVVNEDNSLTRTTDLFDGNHNGSVVWSYHVLLNQYGKLISDSYLKRFEFGVYTTEACSLVSLTSPTIVVNAVATSIDEGTFTVQNNDGTKSTYSWNAPAGFQVVCNGSIYDFIEGSPQNSFDEVMKDGFILTIGSDYTPNTDGMYYASTTGEMTLLNPRSPAGIKYVCDWYGSITTDAPGFLSDLTVRKFDDGKTVVSEPIDQHANPPQEGQLVAIDEANEDHQWSRAGVWRIHDGADHTEPGTTVADGASTLATITGNTITDWSANGGALTLPSTVTLADNANAGMTVSASLPPNFKVESIEVDFDTADDAVVIKVLAIAGNYAALAGTNDDFGENHAVGTFSGYGIATATANLVPARITDVDIDTVMAQIEFTNVSGSTNDFTVTAVRFVGSTAIPWEKEETNHNDRVTIDNCGQIDVSTIDLSFAVGEVLAHWNPIGLNWLDAVRPFDSAAVNGDTYVRAFIDRDTNRFARNLPAWAISAATQPNTPGSIAALAELMAQPGPGQGRAENLLGLHGLPPILTGTEGTTTTGRVSSPMLPDQWTGLMLAGALLTDPAPAPFTDNTLKMSFTCQKLPTGGASSDFYEIILYRPTDKSYPEFGLKQRGPGAAVLGTDPGTVEAGWYWYFQVTGDDGEERLWFSTVPATRWIWRRRVDVVVTVDGTTGIVTLSEDGTPMTGLATMDPFTAFAALVPGTPLILNPSGWLLDNASYGPIDGDPLWTVPSAELTEGRYAQDGWISSARALTADRARVIAASVPNGHQTTNHALADLPTDEGRTFIADIRLYGDDNQQPSVILSSGDPVGLEGDPTPGWIFAVFTDAFFTGTTAVAFISDGANSVQLSATAPLPDEFRVAMIWDPVGGTASLVIAGELIDSQGITAFTERVVVPSFQLASGPYDWVSGGIALEALDVETIAEFDTGSGIIDLADAPLYPSGSYDPASPSDWDPVPTTTAGAIDQISHRVASATGVTLQDVPSNATTNIVGGSVTKCRGDMGEGDGSLNMPDPTAQGENSPITVTNYGTANNIIVQQFDSETLDGQTSVTIGPGFSITWELFPDNNWHATASTASLV